MQKKGKFLPQLTPEGTEVMLALPSSMGQTGETGDRAMHKTHSNGCGASGAFVCGPVEAAFLEWNGTWVMSTSILLPSKPEGIHVILPHPGVRNVTFPFLEHQLNLPPAPYAWQVGNSILSLLGLLSLLHELTWELWAHRSLESQSGTSPWRSSLLQLLPIC